MARDRQYGKPSPDENEETNPEATQYPGQQAPTESTGGGTGSGSTAGQTDSETPPADGEAPK